MGILKRIFDVLTIFCYIFVGAYIIISVPIAFKYTPIVVLSGSMEPTFKVGSIIYYHDVEDKNTIQTGNIITYKLNDEVLVTHRVVEKRENNVFFTKGDANDSVDSNTVSESQILGIVNEKSIPYVGYFVQYVNEHFSIVLVVLAILVIEFFLSNLVQKREKNKEKESNNNSKSNNSKKTKK